MQWAWDVKDRIYLHCPNLTPATEIPLYKYYLIKNDVKNARTLTHEDITLKRRVTDATLPSNSPFREVR